VRDPLIANHAALLGLRPEGGPRRYQDYQGHGKCCHPLHESKLAVRTPGVNNLEFWLAACLSRFRHDRRGKSRVGGRPHNRVRSDRAVVSSAAGSGQSVLRPRDARPVGRPPHHRGDRARPAGAGCFRLSHDKRWERRVLPDRDQHSRKGRPRLRAER
jgi:hypothetical protein